jgi:hypothetical protein
MMTIDQLIILLVGVGELLVGGTLVGVTTESLKCTGGELSFSSWISLWTKQVPPLLLPRAHNSSILSHGSLLYSG